MYVPAFVAGDEIDLGTTINWTAVQGRLVYHCTISSSQEQPHGQAPLFSSGSQEADNAGDVSVAAPKASLLFDISA